MLYIIKNITKNKSNKFQRYVPNKCQNAYLWHFVTWDPTSNLTSSHWIFGIPSVQLHHVIWSAPDREPRPIAPWFNGKLMQIYKNHHCNPKALLSKCMIRLCVYVNGLWSMVLGVCVYINLRLFLCVNNPLFTDACIHASLGLRISVNIHPHVYRQYIRHTSTYRIYNILYTYLWRT